MLGGQMRIDLSTRVLKEQILFPTLETIVETFSMNSVGSERVVEITGWPVLHAKYANRKVPIGA
jgi:hypothetical protein